MEPKTIVTKQKEQYIQPADSVEREIITNIPHADPYEFSIFKLSQIVWYIITLIDIVIALRLLFLVLGARRAGFVNFIYNISQPFVSPFLGIFNSPRVQTSYFEVASLVAIIAYILLGLLITGLVRILSTRDTM